MNTGESKVEITLQDSKTKLANRIADLIIALDIKKVDTTISLENCVKIIGEINKGISEIKDISDTLVNIDSSEKAEKIYHLVIDVLFISTEILPFP